MPDPAAIASVRHKPESAFVTSPAELLHVLELDPALPCLDYAHRRTFPLHVPMSFVRRMRRGDPRDPLFLQVWPAAAEAVEVSGFNVDAVGELGQRNTGGLIRKYKGRALVVTTGACAVNCRYCFRRHFPYQASMANNHNWSATLQAIADDPGLDEIILSGGDPLTLPDAKLARLADGLDDIPHLQRLRIHTRLPIVQPQRVNASLLEWLGRGRLQRIIVLHANHAQEINTEVATACAMLAQSGAMLLNQFVLLRGVNDSAQTLATLSRKLCEVRVLPYYLHMLDRVQGAAHFEVDETLAGRIMQELFALLPGYLVPRLVRELPGEVSKTRVQWSD